VLVLTTVRGDPALGAGLVLLLVLGAVTLGLGGVLVLTTLGGITRGQVRRNEVGLLAGLAASRGLTFAARDDDALAVCPEVLSVGAVVPRAERVLAGYTSAGTLTAFEFACLRIEQGETVPYRHVVMSLASPRPPMPSVLLRPVAVPPATAGAPDQWAIEGLPANSPDRSALATALQADLLRLGDAHQGNPVMVRVDEQGVVAWWRGGLHAEALPVQITALAGVADVVATMAAPPPAVDA
jgi:hypothetical protein